jgi:glycolate oxidase FAD binding subunit
MDRDKSDEIEAHVRSAYEASTPIAIVGGNSKAFLGNPCHAAPLSVGEHRGIIRYEPNELVITARSGTPLTEIEQLLAEHNQMLAFEPPHLGENATLGGTIACNLSGPRRPFAGAARDFVLGVTLINGRAERLKLGGQVMKNVAGYDLSRLMTGAFGTLGLLLDITLKVLPRSRATLTVAQRCSAGQAITTMNQWAATPLPLTACAHVDDTLYARLEGAHSALQSARQRIGGEPLDADDFWLNLKEQGLAFFANAEPLWRISVPPTTAPLDLQGASLIDWGGGLRWLHTQAPSARVQDIAARAGGHATLFRSKEGQRVPFQALDPALLALHKRLKAAFDPRGILNPGRLHPEW